MRDTDHYSRLLGIQSPCKVSFFELDEPQLTVTIHVRIDSRAAVHCPHCLCQVPRYNSRRRWRQLDIMQFRTFFESDVPRIECSEHGVVQLRVLWSKKRLATLRC